MQSTSDVVVIGGGIIGFSVAFYLAKAKYGSIILIEKEPVPGAGATSKAAGGIRAQFATKDNVQMSMLSEKLFANFKEETGSEALFDQVGYMFLLRDDEEVTSFKQNVEMQRALGLKVDILKPDEIAR